MPTTHKRLFILFFILTICGCAQIDIPNQDFDASPDQTEAIVVEEGIMVPQTLEPSPRIDDEEKSESGSIDSFTEPTPSTAQDPALQAAIDPQTKSDSSQSPTSPSLSFTENMFGEFPGVSSQWEERKKQLTMQLQEQSKTINALKVQLQLINQVAELVSFMTRASVNEHNNFLMAFTIENRAPFAIKDISITCDQIAPTGAIITSHVETLYDIIKPSTRSTYTPIPYGHKHRQTLSLQCQITNFTVENATLNVSEKE